MLTALSGGSGFTKTQSAQAPLWVFAPPHFASPGLCFAKPLSGLAKRHLPKYVMCHFALYLIENSH
jgi:hypothetical protein